MPRHIEFISEEEGLTARAELLEEKAPKTCELVWGLLPFTGYFEHGIYSGAELAMHLPNFLEIEPENATYAVLPWEIAFASIRSCDYIDLPNDLSEICFFYDRGARPSMVEGPVKVNVFARFIDGQASLYDLCCRVRKEGWKRFTVRRVIDSKGE